MAEEKDKDKQEKSNEGEKKSPIKVIVTKISQEKGVLTCTLRIIIAKKQSEDNPALILYYNNKKERVETTNNVGLVNLEFEKGGDTTVTIEVEGRGEVIEKKITLSETEKARGQRVEDVKVRITKHVVATAIIAFLLYVLAAKAKFAIVVGALIAVFLASYISKLSCTLAAGVVVGGGVLGFMLRHVIKKTGQFSVGFLLVSEIFFIAEEVINNKSEKEKGKEGYNLYPLIPAAFAGIMTILNLFGFRITGTAYWVTALVILLARALPQEIWELAKKGGAGGLLKSFFEMKTISEIFGGREKK